MDQMCKKAGWRCVRIGAGAQSAMVIGESTMLKWSADSWDTQQLVNVIMVHVCSNGVRCKNPNRWSCPLVQW